MNTTSRPTNSSLAQRIAKVRNCMLVEVTAGVPVTNKTLFVALCQNYEQQVMETSCLPSEALQIASHQALSFSHLAAERTSLHRVIDILGRDMSIRQHRIGFSIIRWPNLVDWDDWNDWGDSN